MYRHKSAPSAPAQRDGFFDFFQAKQAVKKTAGLSLTPPGSCKLQVVNIPCQHGWNILLFQSAISKPNGVLKLRQK